MNSKPQSRPSVPEVVPAGAPPWVTRELIDRTIRVWQPYYREPLKPEDALAMILGVAELHRVIGKGAGA